jgi:hypothetical protein
VKLLWSMEMAEYWDHRDKKQYTGEFTGYIYMLGGHRVKIVVRNGWGIGFLWTVNGWQDFTGCGEGSKDELRAEILQRAVQFIDGFPPGDFG